MSTSWCCLGTCGREYHTVRLARERSSAVIRVEDALRSMTYDGTPLLD
jgi:hypothetical protein